MGYRIWGSSALGLVLLATAGYWVLQEKKPEDRPEAHGFTALVWAARSGKAKAIRELTRAGADPDLLDSGPNNWTPLLHAVHKNQLVSVRELIAAGANVNLPAPNGQTPLGLAAAQGEVEIMEELLAAGADPRSRDSHGWTVLQRAVGSGNSRVVEVLLRKDPDLQLGRGPRDWAVRSLARLQGSSDILARLDRKEGRL